MCHSHLFTQQEASLSQQRAPVKSVVYNTPYSRMTPFMINMIVELYRTDLECYAHKMLPRFYIKKSFNDRADSALLYLMRQCPYIHTLVTYLRLTIIMTKIFQMIRERISSSTVLLLAYTAKNLRYFHIRRNAVILKCDWPKSPVIFSFQ